MLAIVLAGGECTRLGQDKLLLPVLGQPLIYRVLTVLEEVFDEILVVGHRRPFLDACQSIRQVEDKIRGVGPIAGIYTGLQSIEDEHAFFVACDLPFLDVAIIRQQLRLAQQGTWDAVVPRHHDLLEPLHAVYAKQCLKPLSELIAKGQYQIRRLYEHVDVRYVDIESELVFRTAFCNINTPQAWQEIERNGAHYQLARSPL